MDKSLEKLNIDDDNEDKEIIHIDENKQEDMIFKEHNAHLWKQRNALVSLMLLQEELNRHGMLSMSIIQF